MYHLLPQSVISDPDPSNIAPDSNFLCIYSIPSRISGRGYKIGPVCVCVSVCPCVCVSVCLSALSRQDVMTSRRDILTSFDNFWARILTKRARRGRARQRSGVFIVHVHVLASASLGSMCVEQLVVS